MTPDFERCHAVTAKWEGGWSNHRDDPGGATMYGVIQTVYDRYRSRKGLPKQSVRRIAKAEALDIYFNEYWQEARCEHLHPGVDLAHYDAAVNSGVGRARKWLAASVGSADHAETVRRYCRRRLSFVQGLRHWKTFGRGWGRRIADIEAKGVAWATVASSSKAVARTTLKQSAVSAQHKSNNMKTGATASGGATVAPLPAEALAPDQIAGGTLLAIIVVFGLLTAFLVWRANVHDARRAAYEVEAETVA